MTENRKNFILHLINEARGNLANGQLEGLDAAAAVHELVTIFFKLSKQTKLQVMIFYIF